MQPPTEVEDLLSARIGFDLHTVGTHAIGAVIRRSMHEAGFSDPAAYARKLVADADTWNRLIDQVVIPETWFFRDIAPFDLVHDFARSHARRASGQVLRILSCPCSSGEEPYSLVMAMLHAGAPADSFTVDAVDLSWNLLGSARAAVYGARSFRTKSPWYRAVYFDPDEVDGMWRLRSSVASLVRFSQGNLIDPDFLENRGQYDLVFCRNLLIYLHAEARLLAIRALSQLLAKDGTLVLGHAEPAFAREQGFASAGPSAAFAFQKPSSRVMPRFKPPMHQRKEVSRVVLPQPPAVAVGAPPPPVTTPLATIAVSPPEPEPSPLIVARQLGDAGKLEEALTICNQYLQRVPDSAEGHFLSGVLHNALGHLDLALNSFRKVLYIHPNHRDALLHLALIREALGDKPGAALLRARALAQADAEETGAR